MSGRQSSAVEKALKDLRRKGASVYRIAAKYGVAPSTLYRAKRRNGSPLTPAKG